MAKGEYFDVFVWQSGRKSKVGYAVYNQKHDCVRVKADPHIDATKIGRAMLKGEIQIEARRPKKPELTAETYDCAALEHDQ